jgi:hypothetical protein
MNRRSFMSLILVALSFSLVRALGLFRTKANKVAESDGAQRLDCRAQQVHVQPGSIVRLPSSPRAGQQISFIYKDHGPKHAKIFSLSHPICNRWAPLHLDAPAVFNLNFDDRVGEWYLINLGAFVPSGLNSAAALG